MPALATVRAALSDRAIDVTPLPAERRRKKLLVAIWIDADRAGMHRRDGRCDRHAGRRSRPSPKAPCAARSRSSGASPARRVLRVSGYLPARILKDRVRSATAQGSGHDNAEAGAENAAGDRRFTAFAEPIARRIGFNHFRANRLRRWRQACRMVVEPLRGRNAKEEALIEMAERLGLGLRTRSL